MLWGLKYFYSAPWYVAVQNKGKIKITKLAEPVCCTAKANQNGIGGIFASCTEAPGEKKKKMLYIFHITCCKVLICEALIKTLLNDLWIAISHSAFLLFYTFLWVTIGAFNFVCILLTNQLLLKTVHRINSMEFLKRCFQLTIVQT